MKKIKQMTVSELLNELISAKIVVNNIYDSGYKNRNATKTNKYFYRRIEKLSKRLDKVLNG